jgi:hypothetical protein
MKFWVSIVSVVYQEPVGAVQTEADHVVDAAFKCTEMIREEFQGQLLVMDPNEIQEFEDLPVDEFISAKTLREKGYRTVQERIESN